MNTTTISCPFPKLESFNLSCYTAYKNFYMSAESQTRQWFADNIKENWNIIDAGANVGMYTIPFALLANRGKVYAFEPTTTVDILKTNILNHPQKLENITIINKPLGENDVTIKDKIHKIWSIETEDKMFEFVKLDTFIKDNNLHIDLIKIDVDSYDYEVLLGTKEFLINNNPYVIVELNSALGLRNHTPKEGIDFMIGLGYKNIACLDGENYIFKK